VPVLAASLEDSNPFSEDTGHPSWQCNLSNFLEDTCWQLSLLCKEDFFLVYWQRDEREVHGNVQVGFLNNNQFPGLEGPHSVFLQGERSTGLLSP